MSNFWKSKTVILSLVFGGISLLAIIGGSVMLAIANNTKFESGKLKLQNSNQTKSSSINPNNLNTYDWYGDVDFIPYEILRVKSPNSDWRPITNNPINKNDKDYQFYQNNEADNFNVYLNIAHHGDTQFEIDFNKLKPSNVLYDVLSNQTLNQNDDNNLTLNWSLTNITNNSPYKITSPSTNVFIIENQNINEPYLSNDFKLGLEVTNKQDNQTQTLKDVNFNISGTKQEYSWKGNINLIQYEMLSVADDNSAYRVVTEKSIASGGDSGYWFIQNGDPNYNFELSYNHHTDNWFKLDFNKLKPSNILNVQDWQNDGLELTWNLTQTNPNSSFVVKSNSRNIFEIINNNPSQPFGNETFQLTLTVKDKWADTNILPYEFAPINLILKNEDYQFKNVDLLQFTNILSAGNNDVNNLVSINQETYPGYGFNIVEPNTLNINMSNYNSRYFKIDLNSLKPSDILKDIPNSLDTNFEYSWAIDQNLNQDSNAVIENNILTFAYDQTYPNVPSLLLTITDKTLTNPTTSSLKLNIKIDGYQLFIPSVNYVEEKETLIVEPTYIKGINPNDKLTYQWQFSDGTIIDNQTNQTLKIDNVKTSQWNNKQVQLAVFINDSKIPLISNVCNIKVTRPPDPISMVIDINPINRYVIENQDLIINPSLISQDKYDISLFKYQWFDVSNNEPIANQTTKEFKINKISRKEWNNKKIKLVINYGKQVFVSNVVTIFVNPDIKVNLDSSINVFETNNLTISPTIINTDNVDESTFLYQWFDITNNQPIRGQTKRDFEINNIDLSWNNKQVKLIVTYNNQSYESNPITINVYEKINIILDNETTILENQTLSIKPNITTNVNNQQITYQWFYKQEQASEWIKINNQTNENLTINQINLDWNNMQLKLVATALNQTFESNVCTLHVYPNIKISLLNEINADDQKELIISPIISGIDNINQSLLTYQWIDAVSNQPIQNQTMKDFHLTDVNSEWNNKQIKLQISYDNQIYESNICTIIVSSKIVISIPSEIILNENDNLKINAQISGIDQTQQTKITYQWYKNENNQWNPIANQNSSNLIIYGVDLSWNNQQIKLEVNLNNTPYYSNVATIKVNSNDQSPGPSPDDKPNQPTPPPSDNPIIPPVNPTPPPSNNIPVKPDAFYIGISPSNYGFLYDINGNLISDQHWTGGYLENVQKARDLLSEINNKLMNPTLTAQEITKLNLQKDICNNMIMTSNLIISGSVLVGFFGIVLIATLIVFCRYAYWFF